jgi:adenylate cyclase class IV
MIISKDAESIISLFEALGFEKKHVKKQLGDGTATDIRMCNADGFHVDVVQMDAIPKDVTQIRMNVDDYDEAVELLSAHGFKNVQGDKVSESPTSKGTSMVSPSGFMIALSHHFRKEDK